MVRNFVKDPNILRVNPCLNEFLVHVKSLNFHSNCKVLDESSFHFWTGDLFIFGVTLTGMVMVSMMAPTRVTGSCHIIQPSVAIPQSSSWRQRTYLNTRAASDALARRYWFKKCSPQKKWLIYTHYSTILCTHYSLFCVLRMCQRFAHITS